jgi:hypothetical protein
MNDLVVALASALITSGLFAALFIIFTARKSGEVEVPWDKIRPILVYVFAKVLELAERQSLGYEAMETFAVDLIHEQIHNTEFFKQEEKDLLTKDLIRALFRKKLKALYDNDVKGKL